MRLRTHFLIALSIAAAVIAPSIKSSATSAPQAPTPRFTAADLRKLHWLEGTWRGTGDVEHPFFERYHFEGESTLLTESFGPDETFKKVVETTRYELSEGRFGNGGDVRWAATSILDDSISFEPVAGARNSFRFQRETEDSWKAILSWPATAGKPARQVIYLMQRYPPTARSQTVTRTYVAARSGGAKNDCSLASPCLSINEAIKRLKPSGTVTILESGDYDSFEIKESDITDPLGHHPPRSVTVEAAPGIVATITGSNDAGVYIKAGDQDRIVLRGLHLDEGSGNVGIGFATGGWVYVESCSISNFNVGIDFKGRGRLYVTDSFFKRNGEGVFAASECVSGTCPPGSSNWTDPPFASIDNCRFELDSRASVAVEDGASVIIRNSVIAGTADYGIIVKARRDRVTTNLFIENTSITGGAFDCKEPCTLGIGVMADGTAQPVNVTLSNTTITQNRTGVVMLGKATVFTFGNNRIRGNGYVPADNVRGKLIPVALR